MGRKPEYRINYRKERNDYWAAVPDGRGGRERIYGQSRAEVLERLNRRIKEKRERPSQDTPIRAEMPLAEYVEHFLKCNENDLERKTLRTYESLLRQHVLPFRTESRTLGSMRICDIRRRHLKALISDKKRKGYTRDTVRLIRASVSTILTDAVDDELIPGNPALRLLAKTRGKEDRIRKAELEETVRAMDGETLDLFLNAARARCPKQAAEVMGKGKGWRNGIHAPTFVGIFITLAKSGMRPSEAFGSHSLRCEIWSDADQGL